jgi:hypothetical protein
MVSGFEFFVMVWLALFLDFGLLLAALKTYVLRVHEKIVAKQGNTMKVVIQYSA